MAATRHLSLFDYIKFKIQFSAVLVTFQVFDSHTCLLVTVQYIWRKLYWAALLLSPTSGWLLHVDIWPPQELLELAALSPAQVLNSVKALTSLILRLPLYCILQYWTSTSNPFSGKRSEESSRIFYQHIPCVLKFPIWLIFFYFFIYFDFLADIFLLGFIIDFSLIQSWHTFQCGNFSCKILVNNTNSPLV